MCDVIESSFTQFCYCLSRLRSPVGGMTMREQQLEGTLRFVNSRVITSRLVHVLCVCVCVYV